VPLSRLLVLAGLITTLALLPAQAWSRGPHKGHGVKSRAAGKDKDSGKGKGKDKDKGSKGKGPGKGPGKNDDPTVTTTGNNTGTGTDSGTSTGTSTDTGTSTGGNSTGVTPPSQPTGPQDAPDGLLVQAPPAFSAAVGAESVQGTVLVKLPGSANFRALDGTLQLPNGTLVDASAGAIRIVNPVALTNGEGAGGIGGPGHPGGADGSGGGPSRQSAVFSGAEFQVVQPGAAIPTTDLVLHGGDLSGCAASGARVRAARSAHSKTVRRVRGSGHGRFRTRGRYGSATVRGTIWTTEDRCDGTLFSVQRGVVGVRDFVRNKSVQVAAGQSYFARAR
jgi:hypothetical protein